MTTPEYQALIHELTMLILKSRDLSSMTTAEIVALYNRTRSRVAESMRLS